MLENLYPIAGQTLSVANGATAFSIASIILDENDVVAGDALSDGASFIPISAVDEGLGTGALEFAWPGTTRSGYAVWWIWRNPAVRQSAQYAAAQASKVSARQALITGQAVLWRVATETNTPWTDPEEGDRYLIGASPTGAWSAKAGYVVERRNGADVFSQAAVGDCAAIQDTNIVKIYSGTTWASATGESSGAIDWEAAVDVASATTTDIGAAASNLVRITGTTTITGLGTAAAGVARWVRFAGALTLTHNATSLILPYGASITTEAGATALFVSEGAGNWRCYWYQPATSSAARTILGALAKAGDTILGPLELATADSEASAATVSLGSTTSNIVEITGTTTITSFGTAAAGVWRWVRFAGALTLTHNATSLIIPYGANITTAAGDTMLVISEGSGNWRVHFYQFAGAAAARTAIGTLAKAGDSFLGASGVQLNATTWTTLSGTAWHANGANTTDVNTVIDAYAATGNYYIRRANGTNASKSALGSEETIGRFGWAGYADGAYTGLRAQFVGRTSEAWTATAQGCKFFLATTTNGTTSLTSRWVFEHNGHFVPFADNTYNIGSGSFRVKEIFAANATINTSDATEKEWRGDLSEAELRVAAKLRQSIGMFRWKESVAEKGDKARQHIGTTAQAVAEAFRSEGLDPAAYGMWCEDEVFDVDPETEAHIPTGRTRQGVRYEQLILFMLAAG